MTYSDSLIDEAEGADDGHAHSQEAGRERIRGRKVAYLKEDLI